ncbi:MAG: AraC family transcriptional regulator [Acidobacteriota bacterium]
MDRSLYLWNGQALLLGEAIDTTPHQHHALQLSIGLNGVFHLRTSRQEQWRQLRIAIIGCDQPHQLDTSGTTVALLFFDPEGEKARQLYRQIDSVETIQLSLLDPFIKQLDDCRQSHDNCQRAAEIINDLVGSLVGTKTSIPKLDTRVIKALDIINSLEDRRISACQLATRIALSESRLSHLFRAQTGLPIRRYLLWLRLRDAINEIARGLSLTAAAHQAGFADAPHMTRTFRQMFGINPAGLFKSSRFIQVNFCS